jgi:hypothetical protein
MPDSPTRASSRDHHADHAVVVAAADALDLSPLSRDVPGARAAVSTLRRERRRVKAILALDLGTRTGWALAEQGRTESGVQVFDVKRGESPGMRYLRFNRWLSDVCHAGLGAVFGTDRLAVGVIVYEQTHQRGGAATEVAAGFSTRVQEFCAQYGLEHAAIHSGTLKRWATGRGNADKPAMVAAAQRRGYQGADEDEADARLLLGYALAELLPALEGAVLAGWARLEAPEPTVG